MITTVLLLVLFAATVLLVAVAWEAFYREYPPVQVPDRGRHRSRD